MARQHGIEPQRARSGPRGQPAAEGRAHASKIERHFGGQLSDKAIAVWGLAFKPGTDDVREAPSLVLIERLLGGEGEGPRLRSRGDGQRPRALYGDRLVYCQKRDDALLGADALAICTEWKQFVHPDFDEMRRLMRRPVIFDGRNLYNPRRMRAAGFTYYSIGRAIVKGQ